jgi:hypothetical protein
MSEQMPEPWKELEQAFIENVVGNGGVLDPLDVDLPDEYGELTVFDVREARGLLMDSWDDPFPSTLEKFRAVASFYDVELVDCIETACSNSEDDIGVKTDLLQYLATETTHSVTDIADVLAHSKSTVRAELDKHGIANERYARWGDGISWTRQSDRIREMDGSACVSCGRSRSDQRDGFDSDLHVHHVIPRRVLETEEQKHAVENLVTLCSECHQQFEAMTPRALFKQVVDG